MSVRDTRAADRRDPGPDPRGDRRPAAGDEARPAPGPGASSAAPAAVDRADVQDLIFFGETRPVFLRLHMSVGAKGFRAAWLDHVRSLHTGLDRNRDGKVTAAELDREAFPDWSGRCRGARRQHRGSSWTIARRMGW